MIHIVSRRTFSVGNDRLVDLRRGSISIVEERMSKEWISVSELAEKWHINRQQVISLIRSRQIAAMNFAANPDAKRPRFRVPISEVSRFERVRSTMQLETRSA